MYVCVRMWWESDEKGKQAKATLERKDWGKAEEARWQTDDKRDVWWRLISPITDIHPGKKQRWTNAKQRVQQQQQRGGRVGEVDTCIQTQGMTRYAPLFPEPSYPEVIPATTARNFPLCICFAHFMTIIFLPIPRKISFMINGYSWECLSKKFFFSFLSLEGLGESQWGVLHVAVSRSTLHVWRVTVC